MTYNDLATRAWRGELTVREVNAARKEKLDKKDENNGNTLLYCASASCPTEVVEAILDKGVDIDEMSGSYNHYTPLSIAANYGKWDNVKLLLRRGANANLGVC
jgi:ankyrin repeat protein